MQEDLFETRDRVYLQVLQERKTQLKEELNHVQNEMGKIITEGAGHYVGGRLWLSQHPSRGLIAYSRDRNGEIQFLSVVSVDLIREALDKVDKETQSRGPENFSGDDGSSPPRGAW